MLTNDNGRKGEHDTLPLLALLALATTGFTGILNETLPAGLLPQISQSFHVTESLAGQLVSIYAAGTIIATIPLVSLTQGLNRRPTLLAGIVGLLLANTLFAVSTGIWLALLARFFAGVASGLAWGVLAGYARRMVVDDLKGRALAVAMIGTPVALSAGVPLGTFLGDAFGWRTTFLGLSLTTAALALWVALRMPDYPGQAAHQRYRVLNVIRLPGIAPILIVTFAWMTAHNILYTYISPLAAVAGLRDGVAILLFLFGGSALAGIWITGWLIARHLRRLVLVSLLAFCAVGVGLSMATSSSAVLLISMVIWGLSFGGAATQILTACADAAGDSMDLANALIATVWNTAIAAGGIVGGLILTNGTGSSLAQAVVGLTLVGFVVAFKSTRSAFKPDYGQAH